MALSQPKGIGYLDHRAAGPCTVVCIYLEFFPIIEDRQNDKGRAKFTKNPLQNTEKRVSYSGILQNANEMGRCRDERKESRRLVKFRTGGAARDHLSSGCAETKVGADGSAPLRYNEVDASKSGADFRPRLWDLPETESEAGPAACRRQFGWYREQPRPNGIRLLLYTQNWRESHVSEGFD